MRRAFFVYVVKKIMKLVKRLLITIASITLILGGGFYLYIKTLPTAPPDFVLASEIDNSQPAIQFACSNSAKLEYAYKVDVAVESKLNDKMVYQSNIQFDTQISQTNDAIAQGIASNIVVQENDRKASISDVHFISRIQATPYLLFSAFNDLGLPEKHPMKILSQFIKAISVGDPDEKYHFAYDSMQRTYQYKHEGNKVNRTSSVTTTNSNQLLNTLQSFDDSWHVLLNDDCMPNTMSSIERQGIVAAGHGGYIKFSLTASRIPSFTDLSTIQLNDYSNRGNQWAAAEIANAAFENKVLSSDEMWSVIAGFNDSKNTARLIKAADFLIENVDAIEAAQALSGLELNDQSKRDLAFALSLSNNPNAESFILDTLDALPKNAGNDGDLQKIRLMVALSGNGQVSSQGYYGLSSIASNTDESANVRNNALINMASTVQQIENAGQGGSGLKDDLSEKLGNEIENGNSPSAILAAGNAKLDQLNDTIASSLSSSDSKERYAAGTVLAREPEYTDLVIDHLRNEPSALVSNAILGNLNPAELSASQKAELADIADSSSADIAHIINNLIK